MIMVQTVMFPPVAQKIFWRAQLMHSVMYNKVRRITYRKTGKEYQSVMAKNKAEQKKEYNRQCHGNNRRHDKTVFVFWIFVVYTVDGILYFSLSFIFCREVIHKTVHQVFHQRKCQHACNKIQDHNYRRNVIMFRVINRNGNGKQEKKRYRKRKRSP